MSSMKIPCSSGRKIGDPGVIRTRDIQFRRLMLYPAELRGRAFIIAHSAKQDKAKTAEGTASATFCIFFTQSDR